MLSTTTRGAGGGVFILWKGAEIEHFNRRDMLETHGPELRRRCEHLERLGVPVSTSSVVWCWEWFADCPVESKWLPLLRLLPELYEHGNTPERAAALRAASVPPVACSPDGSIAFSRGGRVVRWTRDGGAELADVRPDELGGLYHPMHAAGYGTADLGQRVYLGCCYATFPAVAEWLERYAVDAAAVVELLNA